MIRRSPWRKVFLAAIFLVPAGCEPLHSWVRHKEDDPAKDFAAGNPTEEDVKSRKVIGGSGDDSDTSGFFKKNRRSGGLSSEAREIESHLGAD